MFYNAYQNGTHVEIFDPKEAHNKANKEKDKFYSSLFKVNAPPHCQKIFDKMIKGYIFEIDGYNTKLQLPKEDKIELYLTQQFVVLQVQVPIGLPWSLELVVSDTSKTKRRIMLTSSIKTLEKKYFHVKVPIDTLKRGVWLNLAVDVWSFMEGWKGSTFRSLDMIIISSPCKLRKIFGMRYPPLDEDDIEGSLQKKFLYIQIKLLSAQQVPKNVNFPPGFQYSTQILTFKNLTELQPQIPENIEILESQHLSEDQQLGQKQRTTQFSQKSTGFKRKTLQINDKSTRGSQHERVETADDQTPQNKQLRKQPQVEFENEFQEVEENIEGENNEEFDNEFQHGDDLNQFQQIQSSFNDPFTLVGQKIFPSTLYQKKSLLGKENSSTSKKPQPKQQKQPDPIGSQTGFTLSSQGQPQARQIKSPKGSGIENKKNPWGAKANNRSEKIKAPSDLKNPQYKSPLRNNPRIRNNNLEIEESAEQQQQLDQLSTQKKQFLKNKDKQNPQRQLKNQKTTNNQISNRQQQQLSVENHEQSTDDYLKMTQKFSTISDYQGFQISQQIPKEEPVPIQNEINNRQKMGRASLDDEIEENIEVENTLSVVKIQTQQQQNLQIPNNFNKRSISELRNDSEHFNNMEDDPELQDSLEIPPLMTSYNKQTYSQNKWKLKKQDDSETTFTDGFYANQLKKYTEVLHRPFTPEYNELGGNIQHNKERQMEPNF